MLSGIVEFLGWFGAVTVLAGYILFSTGRLPNGPVYQLFNLVGGVSVAVNVAAHHAVPSTIVNGIWAVVAVVVLIRMGASRRAAKRTGLTPHHELTTEPPATTAVLPVIGPAVRHHDADGTAAPDAPADLTTPRDPAVPHDPAALRDPAAARDLAALRDLAAPRDPAASRDLHAPHEPDATVPAGATTVLPAATAQPAPEPAAPMTASVPVITATIALALVSAAQDQQRARRDGHEPAQQR